MKLVLKVALSVGRNAVDAADRDGHGSGTFSARQLSQRDIAQGAVDSGVDSLPRVTDLATRLIPAGAVLATAFGDRKWSFERIENVRCGNASSRTSELVTAVTATRRAHQAATLQLFQ
jgi:hypothetical protein